VLNFVSGLIYEHEADWPKLFAGTVCDIALKIHKMNRQALFLEKFTMKTA